MKSRYWVAILAVILLLCAVPALLPAANQVSESVQIKYGNGVLTLDLNEDQEHTFPSADGGYNTVTIRDGKIAVTAADCPDGYCMDRGFCDGGAPIVCLPHKLVIEFMGRQEIDGIIG